MAWLVLLTSMKGWLPALYITRNVGFLKWNLKTGSGSDPHQYSHLAGKAARCGTYFTSPLPVQSGTSVLYTGQCFQLTQIAAANMTAFLLAPNK